ncbi:MAG TPA: 3-oxoacyl-[acyl-carrier-protein] synthase III C-terminal domain-containing protein [Verrucomicrobiae bacterium]|jgi:alkylresorcinol/alkylpyrone synthase|nr:3-oxoacyl-[acyl-carrier-protein] synthase III C-terminal domain-containing protein [Verrucomicrobiae bacterium]
MFITGIGTAAPPQSYKQTEAWAALQASQPFSRLTPRSHAILRKILTGNNGIETRHLALDSLHDVFETNPDILHARFAKHGPLLATQAAEHALRDAQISVSEIDALLVSTCTGYLCPGLTSYVSERLGLRTDALLLDLVGQGCGAALPNLRTAEALLVSGKCKRVLSVCVEICSAAFYIDDDPGVLVSACLFGDGAGAAVLSNEPAPHQRPIQWLASRTQLSAADRDLLRFEQKNGMLRNILSAKVPPLAAQFAADVLDATLADARLTRSDIAAWIWHAGGRDVLTALQERLSLTADQVCWSANILREFGNVSSPCVYFVLQAALADAAPAGHWWLSSFGAGFSCHGALLKVG